MITSYTLVSAETSRALDMEAQTEWGFNVFSLIESAGRLCAQALLNYFLELFNQRFRTKSLRISVVAGTGNNGADAMAALRYLILSNIVDAEHSALIISRSPKADETGPWIEILKSLKKMKVNVTVFENSKGEGSYSHIQDTLTQSDIIIDGIAGTGIKGPLKGAALEMAEAINSLKGKSKNTPHQTEPFVVSIDLPSGNFDGWKTQMPIINANLTLAIEPQKYCVYTPAARPHAGIIMPVTGVFPGALIEGCKGVELLDWETVSKRVNKIRPDAYKNDRGTVEIRAGSAGASGAALIAARGAQAGGAGLVRLVADDNIYPILAAGAGGIMVSPVSAEDDAFNGRHKPEAILLGPGWGATENRLEIIKKALAKEKAGTALILDADAIEPLRSTVFNDNAIITPHPGEFSKFLSVEKEECLTNTASILIKCSRECNGTILFKNHVITIASPDGRLGVVDGMMPGLAAGGSGDLLAGLCADIAARMVREGCFDAFTCAAAAASLLVASGCSNGLKTRFTDPVEIAGSAADLAGKAWL
jgi:NAD(P)H-hydrate epimerase